MVEWAEETGSSRCERPDLTVAEITEFMANGLSDRETTEVEDFLCRIGAYNLWLRNTAGSVLAMIRELEAKLNRGVARHMRSVSKQYAALEVKEAMILNKHPDLAKIHDRLTRLRMRYDKIRNLPQSIDASMRTIENALRRRNGY